MEINFLMGLLKLLANREIVYKKIRKLNFDRDL